MTDTRSSCGCQSHSNNVAARPEVGIVIFDSTVPEGSADAVYIEGTAIQAEETDLNRMLAVFSKRSTDRGGAVWTTANVTGENGEYEYSGETTMHWDGQYTTSNKKGQTLVTCPNGHEWPAEIED